MAGYSVPELSPQAETSLSDDFSDLDNLLEESVELQKTKKQVAKRRFITGQEGPEELPLGEGWRTLFRCAIFIEHHCQCGEKVQFFSHWAKRQELKERKQWLRSERPLEGQEVRRPRIKKESVEVCPRCLPLDNGKELGTEGNIVQLKLWR